ncbi:hypothetical protein AQJ46_50270 [Streptomyces canus]|uniref:Uncharacterized protein n=1 Tax=Streptomyces canus TaxID=58343 RepID=A0A101RJW7_9ACTN|nr:hypothetical protein AQJ46_50270 [Streptomyces canus]
MTLPASAADHARRLQVFSGKSRPDLVKFLSLVRALGGAPRQWEPSWHRPAAEEAALSTRNHP